MQIEQLRQKLGHLGVPNNGNYYALKVMQDTPDKMAIKYPRIVNGQLQYQELSFGEFKSESLKWASGLKQQGFKQGDRVVLLIPVSMELYQLIFACFYLGLSPVFIDISMGPKKLVQSIKASKARGIISIDKLLKFKYFTPAMWFKKCYSQDRKRFLIRPLSILFSSQILKESEAILENNSSALITFTSGTTGKPKGANRTIEVLLNQKIVSEYMWPHTKDEVDMPAFPMIVLQNLGCGVSSILPSINFQNFLEMNPKIIVEQLINEKVTRFSAQPFFIDQIADYLLGNNVQIKSLRSLVVGGASVSKALCRKVLKAFPGVDANVVYGSTEAEPISHISMQEIVKTKGRGLLLGNIVESLQVKILAVKDHPNIDQDTIKNGVGEIVLAGPHVIKEYIDNHPANLELKLKDRNGQIWHRTGDMGYFDESGRLWLVGRIKDRIHSTNGLVPCYDLEEDLQEILGINKVAFLNNPQALVIEGAKDIDLVKIQQFLKNHKLNHFKIKFLDKIPVDKRHFSRVDRAELAKMLI